MENEEQSVQDLVVGFAIQACCSLEKKPVNENEARTW